jgi:hypothetical protein
VSFAAVNLFVASQRVFIVVVYFVIESVRKLVQFTDKYGDLRFPTVAWQIGQQTNLLMSFD